MLVGPRSAWVPCRGSRLSGVLRARRKVRCECSGLSRPGRRYMLEKQITRILRMTQIEPAGCSPLFKAVSVASVRSGSSAVQNLLERPRATLSRPGRHYMLEKQMTLILRMKLIKPAGCSPSFKGRISSIRKIRVICSSDLAGASTRTEIGNCPRRQTQKLPPISTAFANSGDNPLHRSRKFGSAVNAITLPRPTRSVQRYGDSARRSGTSGQR